MNRFRLEVDLHSASWLRVTAQVQDARSGFQNPPIGPPNTVRWDLKLAYVEVGNPDKHWISLRVGRQLINYNNTIIANSEWRNQARSYDAAVLNLNAKREHLGVFAASAVVSQASGVSPHQEGDNIYGAYGRIDDFVAPHSNLEPFFLWRVQPAEVVEPGVAKTTGKENEKVFGLRFKGQAHTAFNYSGELIAEDANRWDDKMSSHAAVSGFVTQIVRGADGDTEVHVCENPKIAGMDRARCIVAKCIAKIPCDLPVVGRPITVKGITRYDAGVGAHWWEIHPVEEVEK